MNKKIVKLGYSQTRSEGFAIRRNSDQRGAFEGIYTIFAEINFVLILGIWKYAWSKKNGNSMRSLL